MVSPATLSRVEWIMRPSKKQELLSCMGESQTSQVEFSSAGATGGSNLPQVDLAKAPYPVRKEKFDRMLNGALCFQPDLGNQFVSGLQLYQNEFRLSSISSNPNFVGECKIYREVISTESGTNANKVDSAFREDLSLVGSDKDKILQKIGLQMHKKVHRLHVRSQADEFLSVNNFSRCFAEVSEQTPPSTSCRRAQSSVSCSIQRKKSTKPLSKRRRACMDWDFSDWEYEEALPLGNCSGGQSSGSCSQPQRKSARLLNKRKRVCMDLDLLNWELEEAQNVVLLDDEDLCGETMDGSDDEWKKFRLYYPSRNDPESVALSYSDMECLNPEQFLSSPVMNFYIQYLRSESTIGRPQGEYHIFNTFFFGKLERALSQKVDGSQCFLKLRRWWKGVNIFSKAYILLPIHGSSHWSLAIICNPGIEEDDSNLLILHLDSLGLHSSQQISQIISIFLQEEWNFMNQNPAAADLPFPLQRHIWQHLQLRIDRKKVKVPQQKNEYDCGIFVLYFIQRFLEEAPQRLRLHDLSMFHSKWFKPAEASSLRKRIHNLLIEEFNKAAGLP